MNRPSPRLVDVDHGVVCYSKDTYCGHPRQSGIYDYGGGELVVMHSHAPCRYQKPNDISHSFVHGYASRAVIVLQRSTDSGETWPREHDVVVYDESAPIEVRRAFLAQADERSVARDHIDLTSPAAAVYFGRTATGAADDTGAPSLQAFAIRSGDRGRTWERVPTVVAPPPERSYVHKDAHPLVLLPDGSLLAAMSVSPPGAVALYGSDDNGLTWEYLAEIARDPTGLGRPTYAGLLGLPDGRLQCYMLNIGGLRNAMQLASSDDGGYSWSGPTPIVAWGQSPWTARRAPDVARPGVYYRSPWPLRLRDGRIIVLFGRRKPPFGIGLIASEDNGATWSAESIIRDDASGPDLGYPVATELEDGRIFTAYYFMRDDGNGAGGTRFIASSTFRL